MPALPRNYHDFLFGGFGPTEPFGTLPPHIRAAYPGAALELDGGTIRVCKWGGWGQTTAAYKAAHNSIAGILEREGIEPGELVLGRELLAAECREIAELI